MILAILSTIMRSTIPVGFPGESWSSLLPPEDVDGIMKSWWGDLPSGQPGGKGDSEIPGIPDIESLLFFFIAIEHQKEEVPSK